MAAAQVARLLSRWVARRLIMTLAPRAAVTMTAAGAGAGYHSSIVHVTTPEIHAPVEDVEAMDLRGKLPTHASKVYALRDPARVEGLIWHHTASSGQSLANIARFHVQGRDWPGISYHYAIGWDGTLYVLWGHEVATYHTAGYNARNISCALVGNYQERELTDAQKVTIERLRRKLRREGINVEYLHRDLGRTACPGINAVRYLRPHER